MKKCFLFICTFILLTGYLNKMNVNAEIIVCKECHNYESIDLIDYQNELSENGYAIPEDVYMDIDELAREYIDANVPQGAKWVKNNGNSLYLCNVHAGYEGFGGSAFIDSFFCQFFDVYTFTYMDDGTEKTVVVVDYIASQGVYSDDELCLYTKNFANINEDITALVYSKNSDTKSWEYQKEIPVKSYIDEEWGNWCLQVSGKNWKNRDSKQSMRCIFSFHADIGDKMEEDIYCFPYYYAENKQLRENVLWIGDWGIEIWGLKWLKLFVKIAIPVAIVMYLVKKWLHKRHVRKLMGKK